MPIHSGAYTANYVNTYVAYVCPMKRSFVNAKTCFATLPAPPVDVQESIVDVVERAPVPMRGFLMDSLIHDRLADAKFLVAHVDEFMEFARIAAVSQQVDERDFTQFDETVM